MIIIHLIVFLSYQKALFIIILETFKKKSIILQKKSNIEGVSP